MRLHTVALVAALALSPSIALADDGGDAGDASDEASPEGIQPTTTSDNLGCNQSGSRPDAMWLVLPLAIFALRRRFGRRRALAAAAIALAPASALAQVAPDELAERAPETRRFAVYLNAMSFIVNRYGASIEVLLASHHALEAGAYYVYSETNNDSNNVFRGVGGELGYRFYLGQNGFRGFYVGPSFLLAALEAVPRSGATVSYFDLGGALDLGWEALVADRVLVGIGAGAQYTANTKTLPPQQIPASVYANDGIRPRVSIAIGVAF